MLVMCHSTKVKSSQAKKYVRRFFYLLRFYRKKRITKNKPFENPFRPSFVLWEGALRLFSVYLTINYMPVCLLLCSNVFCCSSSSSRFFFLFLQLHGTRQKYFMEILRVWWQTIRISTAARHGLAHALGHMREFGYMQNHFDSCTKSSAHHTNTLTCSYSGPQFCKTPDRSTWT